MSSILFNSFFLKLIVEKLIDNQLRIFSQHTNLSNEKALIQQFNALNHELDLLKIQLNKVNQLLNDTIVEKCKQELNFQSINEAQQKALNQDNQYNHRQQQQNSHEPTLNTNLNPMQQYKIKTYFDSHTNINESINNQKQDNNNNSLLNNTSIWKQPTPQKHQQQYYFTSLVDTNKNIDQLDSKNQQPQYFSNNHRTILSNNDKIREKRRASIGKVPHNFNIQSSIPNENKPSAMERLFGSQKNLDQLNAIKKIAMVKPEMRAEDTAYVYIVLILKFLNIFIS